MTGTTRTLTWPDEDIETIDVDGWPVIYAIVTTPADQALLHRHLALLGYCPVHLTTWDGDDLFRFHHPDGPKPL